MELYWLFRSLDEHPGYVQSAGSRIRVTHADFDPQRNVIAFIADHETVRIFPEPTPQDPDLFLQLECTCDAAAPFGAAGPCRHSYAASLYLKNLFDLVPMPPLVKKILGFSETSWKVALNELSQIVHQMAVIGDHVNSNVLTAPQTRLAWRVDLHPRYGQIQIEPIEQTASAKKKESWTKGRVIRWDKIIEGDLNVLPVDYAVMRAADVKSYRTEPESYRLGLVFQALIGHPHVFVESTPISVRSGTLGLSLDDLNETWKLVPHLEGRPLKDYNPVAIFGRQHLVAYDSERREVIVAVVLDKMLQFCNSLARNPVVIPPEAQSQYVKLLPALEASFPINLPVSLKGALVPADERITLRIHPVIPSGAKIELTVTPAPLGMNFVPGEGPVEVLGKKSSSTDSTERVRVERDLAAEVQRATALADELFLNRFTQTSPFAWTLDNDDDVLDLLDALRARPDEDPLVAWPSDANVRTMAVLGEVSASSLKVEIKDQHDWFGISGSVELGGQKFPLVELLAALREGRRYVSLGKGQFASITQAFRDRLAAVADMLHSNRGKLEFNSTAVPVIADLLEDQTALKASKKWKETLTRMNRAVDLDPQVPTTLTAELRDYQVDGYKWLCRLAEWGVGGILADDMGLGKTVQALAVLIARRELGPILVVAPVSVGANWQRETERFAPTINPILYRETDRVDVLKALRPGDMLITSYHLLQQHSEALSAMSWGTLVLDEAQYIKNSQTKTAQVVRGLEANWRLALTGTPCENHLGDLWSVFRGVSPGLFGSWERFREVFADPIEKAKLNERRHALSRVLRPFVLRRTKSEVLKELPARTEIQLMAELSDTERQRYEDARLWAVTHLAGLAGDAGKDPRFQVLAALTKLRQLACHPRLIDESWDRSSAKLDLFLETIDELREGKHRALVFSQFTSHLDLIREALDQRKITYQYLDGKTPPKKRQQRVDAFQKGDGEFFLISLKAGGTGLNLTGADYVIHLDPWWNPAVEDQATDRAHRIGQTRPVTVYRLVAKETIEEQILKLHADKRNLVAGILDGTDQAAKLSTQELIDLIKTGGRQT